MDQFGQFLEQVRFHPLEVEAGFALHVIAQFGRDALQQIREHVDGHEVERDVILLDLGGGEEERLLPCFAVGAVDGDACGSIECEG